MSQALPPPPYNMPISNQAGLLNNAWLKWFQTAYERMGGAQALSNHELASTQVSTSSTQSSSISTLNSLINQAGSVVVNATSSSYTAAASGQWQALSGNSLNLTSGRWLLSGMVSFVNLLNSPAWTKVGTTWGASTGADSSTAPSFITTTPNLTVLSVLPAYGPWTFLEPGNAGNGFENIPAMNMTVSVQANSTATVYLNSFSSFTGSAANTYITAYLTATLLRYAP